MIKEYKGQKAVVTGAANGIGRALAMGMAKRGADVLVVDIHGDEAEKVCEEIKAMGREAYALQADVSLKTECKKRGNPKFCVNTICGANRAKFIQGGSRENPAAAFSTT